MYQVVSLKPNDVWFEPSFARFDAHNECVIKVAQSVKEIGLISSVIVTDFTDELREKFYSTDSPAKYFLVNGYLRWVAVFAINKAKSISAIIIPDLKLCEINSIKIAESNKVTLKEIKNVW